MLFFLFTGDELRRIFTRLGYDYPPGTASRNISYYSARTTYGSTVSFVVHAHVLAALDPEGSWAMFQTALESDVGDIQGGTTKEGIYMGVMAGTLDLIQRGYLGTTIRDATLYFDPRQTERLEGLSLPMRFRGMPLEVSLEEGEVRISTQGDGRGGSVKVGLGDEVRELRRGDRHAFPAAKPASNRA